MSRKITPLPTNSCPHCGTVLRQTGRGRPRIWCSDRCRRLAHAHATSASEHGHPVRVMRPVLTPTDLDAAVNLVLASPPASRRVLKTLRRRHQGGRLDDAKWWQVIDLLRAPLREPRQPNERSK